VRGADPSLNQIAIDGVVAATPEADGRTTALNIISIDQLESIELVKSWLPDKSANFIGGSVNLITRSALDRGERFASAEAAYGQHSIADDPSYRFKATFGDVLFKNKSLGIQVSFDYADDHRGSETLSAGYHPDVESVYDPTTTPTHGWQLDRLAYEIYSINRERTGISGKVEYRINEQNRLYASISHNKFDDVEVRESAVFQTGVQRSNDFAGRSVMTADVAEDLGLDPNDPEVAERIASFGKLTFQEGIQLGENGFDETTKNFTLQTYASESTKAWQSRLTEDTITTVQAGGEHRLWDRVDLDYKIYRSEADKVRDAGHINLWAPDHASVFGIGPDGLPHFSAQGEGFNDPDKYQLLESARRGSVRYEDSVFLDERTGFEANVEVKYDSGDMHWSSKAGLAGDYRTRNVDVAPQVFTGLDREGQDVLVLSEPHFDGGLRGSFLEDYGDYTYGPQLNVEGSRAFLADPGEFGVELVEVSGDSVTRVVGPITDNYESTEDIFAGYFMQTLDWKDFRFIAGFRYEKTENTFSNLLIDTRSPLLDQLPPQAPRFASPSFWSAILRNPLLGPDALLQEVSNSRDYENWLPAVHVIKRWSEERVVRASYTETIARPKFTDLLPFESVAVGDGVFKNIAVLGNYDLMPTGSQNFDLAYERYFKKFGQFGVSFFHKKLDGPIYTESLQQLPGATPIITHLNEKYTSDGLDDGVWFTEQVVNAGDGEITGVEISLARKLDFLPDPWNGFGLEGNITLTDSEVQLLVDIRENEVAPLFKQSDLLANLSLYYENRFLLVRASMLWRSDYLNTVEVDAGRLQQLWESQLTDEPNFILPQNSRDTYFDDFFKLDVRAEWRFNRNWIVFFEGTNLTGEPVTQYQGDPSRVSSLVSTEPVYFIGVKWNM
jgi:TonB-dependent receptor